MVNEKTTQGAGADSVVLCAVFNAPLFPLLQQVFGDGWTILGAVVGAALGALGCVIHRNVGGYASRLRHRSGSSKPLSKKWAVAEGVWALVTLGLMWELIWHRLLVGLAVGALFAPALFAGRLLIESHRHVAPKPTPWAPIVGGGVGCVIGVIVGGVWFGLYGGVYFGVYGAWLNGFTGMIAGAAVGAIVHNPKWAFWGGVIGLAFCGLVESACLVIDRVYGPPSPVGWQWEAHPFFVVFFTLLFAAVGACLKEILPGPAVKTNGESGLTKDTTTT